MTDGAERAVDVGLDEWHLPREGVDGASLAGDRLPGARRASFAIQLSGLRQVAGELRTIVAGLLEREMMQPGVVGDDHARGPAGDGGDGAVEADVVAEVVD